MRKQTIKTNMRYSILTGFRRPWISSAKISEAVVLKFSVLAKLRAIATLFSVIFLILLAAGCSSEPVRASSPQSVAVRHSTSHRGNDSIQQRLHKQYLAWKGVPYKEGGNNKRGVDCSGFVQITFKKALGVNVPRTTRMLLKIGKTIPRRRLSVGDLVFFRTGRSKQHVGIYVGKGQFIHASTSKGVIKSNLKSKYWRKHYWKSSRVLNI